MSIRDDGFDLDAIRRINNTVVNDDGTVKSFKEQLLEYEYGYYNAFLPFIVYGDSRAICTVRCIQSPHRHERERAGEAEAET